MLHAIGFYADNTALMLCDLCDSTFPEQEIPSHLLGCTEPEDDTLADYDPEFWHDWSGLDFHDNLNPTRQR